VCAGEGASIDATTASPRLPEFGRELIIEGTVAGEPRSRGGPL
jgi:hypothetical protein